MSYIFPSLTYDSLWVHPCCCKWPYFILFNGRVIFQCIHICMCACVYIDIYIYTPHLLYPVLCQYLNSFHALAIVNSAALNTGVHVSFQAMFFSRYMPRSGIVQSCAMLCHSELLQSYPTLCDPMDCSLPSSSVHGIL